MITTSCFPYFNNFNQFCSKFGYIREPIKRVCVELDGFTLQPGQQFDIQDGLFILKNSGLSGGPVETQIRTYLINGRGANGLWNGTPGQSSIFTSYSVNGFKGVGYRLAGNGDLFLGFALPGDCNLTGGVDANKENPDDTDFLVGAGKFNTGQAAKWHQGDFNYDGLYNSKDTALMAAVKATFGNKKYLPFHSEDITMIGNIRPPAPQPHTKSYEGYRLPGYELRDDPKRGTYKYYPIHNYIKTQDPALFAQNAPGDIEGHTEAEINIQTNAKNWGLYRCSQPNAMWS